jgi:hypothetical protein
VVRSFRSQRFRFEATLEAQQGDVRPRLILTQGAVSRAIVRLDPDGVRLTVREPTGTGGLALDCSDQPQVFSGLATRVVAVVRSDRIDLTIGDGETVTCPGLGGGPYGIGLGAVGTGRIRASDLRLSRL